MCSCVDLSFDFGAMPLTANLCDIQHGNNKGMTYYLDWVPLTTEAYLLFLAQVHSSLSHCCHMIPIPDSFE